jgi:hypothetical protein
VQSWSGSHNSPLEKSTGLRLILQSVDPAMLAAALRRHATEGLVAIGVDCKPSRQFRRLQRPQAAHMISALRHADQIVLGRLIVEEKSDEIPTAPELIEAWRRERRPSRG